MKLVIKNNTDNEDVIELWLENGPEGVIKLMSKKGGNGTSSLCELTIFPNGSGKRGTLSGDDCNLYF